MGWVGSGSSNPANVSQSYQQFSRLSLLFITIPIKRQIKEGTKSHFSRLPVFMNSHGSNVTRSEVNVNSLQQFFGNCCRRECDSLSNKQQNLSYCLPCCMMGNLIPNCVGSGTWISDVRI